MKLRINKFLSEHHYCSRREADRLIQAGKVFVNNRPAQLGDQISDTDVVRVMGRDKRPAQNKLYLLLNKPAGISTHREVEDNIFDLIKIDEKIFPVGEMDVRDEGLLILTNDWFFAKRLVLPKFENDQEYVIEVDRDLARGDIAKMQNGIRLKDGMTKKAKVRQLDARRFAIVIDPLLTKEGAGGRSASNHVRHMCEALGYRVNTVMRTRILTLKMVSTHPIGNWRHLTESEISDLKKAVGIKTHKQKLPPRQAARRTLHRK